MNTVKTELQVKRENFKIACIDYMQGIGMMEAHIFFLDHKCTADTKMLNPMWFLLFAHPDLIFIHHSTLYNCTTKFYTFSCTNLKK